VNANAVTKFPREVRILENFAPIAVLATNVNSKKRTAINTEDGWFCKEFLRQRA